MRQQSYIEYLKARIKFQIQVGAYLEFDYEGELSMKDEPNPQRGDVSIPCMPMCEIAQTNPNNIAQKLKPYVEELEEISKVEILNGYLNVFFHRNLFLMNIIEVNYENFNCKDESI